MKSLHGPGQSSAAASETLSEACALEVAKHPGPAGMGTRSFRKGSGLEVGGKGLDLAVPLTNWTSGSSSVKWERISQAHEPVVKKKLNPV